MGMAAPPPVLAVPVIVIRSCRVVRIRIEVGNPLR